jgi:hypothetical protein
MNLFKYINKKINDLILKNFENTLNKDESEWLNIRHKEHLSFNESYKFRELQEKAFKFITRKAQLIELKAINEGKSAYEAGKEALDFANKTIEDLKLKGKYDNVPKHSYQVCAEKIIEELGQTCDTDADISEGTINMNTFAHNKRLDEETGLKLEQKRKDVISLSILLSIFALTSVFIYNVFFLILLIPLYSLVLTFFITLIFSKKYANFWHEAVWFLSYLLNSALVSFGSIFVALTINGILKNICDYTLIYIWILYLLYVLLTLFLLSWSGREMPNFDEKFS